MKDKQAERERAGSQSRVGHAQLWGTPSSHDFILFSQKEGEKELERLPITRNDVFRRHLRIPEAALMLHPKMPVDYFKYSFYHGQGAAQEQDTSPSLCIK